MSAESHQPSRPSWPIAGLSLLIVVFVGCRGELPAGPFEPPQASAPGQNYSGFRSTIGQPFTFGPIFVKNYGPDPATLDSVELVDATPGVTVVGALAADITDQRHNWLSSDAFPPVRPRGAQELAGFVVAPDAAQSVQVLVGIELTGGAQAGFDQVAINYHVGDDEFRYVMPSGAVLCSPSYYESTGRESCDRSTLANGT